MPVMHTIFSRWEITCTGGALFAAQWGKPADAHLMRLCSLPVLGVRQQTATLAGTAGAGARLRARIEGVQASARGFSGEIQRGETGEISPGWGRRRRMEGKCEAAPAKAGRVVYPHFPHFPHANAVGRIEGGGFPSRILCRGTFYTLS